MKPPEVPGDQAFRAGAPLGREPEMTYGGALSFLRRRYTRDLDGADIVVWGVPFDVATSNRPGARFGPRAIRAASVGLAELPAFPWGFDPFQRLAVVDYGDCYLDFGRPEAAVEAIEARAAAILAGGSMLVTLGGDHFVTYPLLRAHADRFGPLALVHFDAHSDTWADDGSRLDHGSMFLRAAREGIVEVSRSVQIGIRTHNPDTHGFTIIDAPRVHREGVAAAVEAAVAVVGDAPAYLTFDVDCLDPAFAPGTGTPVAGGLSTAQALEAVRSLGGLNLVGMDVVEVAPPYDTAEITALAAATLAHDFICLQAAKRPEPPVGPSGA